MANEGGKAIKAISNRVGQYPKNVADMNYEAWQNAPIAKHALPRSRGPGKLVALAITVIIIAAIASWLKWV